MGGSCWFGNVAAVLDEPAPETGTPWYGSKLSGVHGSSEPVGALLGVVMVLSGDGSEASDGFLLGVSPSDLTSEPKVFCA